MAGRCAGGYCCYFASASSCGPPTFPVTIYDGASPLPPPPARSLRQDVSSTLSDVPQGSASTGKPSVGVAAAERAVKGEQRAAVQVVRAVQADIERRPRLCSGRSPDQPSPRDGLVPAMVPPDATGRGHVGDLAARWLERFQPLIVIRLAPSLKPTNLVNTQKFMIHCPRGQHNPEMSAYFSSPPTLRCEAPRHPRRCGAA